VKIEAVTTCVRYTDYLAHTILWNKQHFDNLVVVTDKADTWTQNLCEHHWTKCVVTDAFYANERAFVKSAGINAGLASLDCDGWIVHIDADIVLPPRTRELLGRAVRDPETIYGIDRLNVTSFEDWLLYLSHPEIQFGKIGFVNFNCFPIGTRVVPEEGWSPIGFFQMWNPRSSGRFVYPDHGAADRSDMEFSRQWPREKRQLIPEIIGLHLGTPRPKGGGMGVNWRGRVSQPFGPVPEILVRQELKSY